MKYSYLLIAACLFAACKQTKPSERIYQYPGLLNVTQTVENTKTYPALFKDKGAWFGFSAANLPQEINGLTGPWLVDYNDRQQVAASLLNVGISSATDCRVDSVTYYPGELWLTASSDEGPISQKAIFADANHVLIECKAPPSAKLNFRSIQINPLAKVSEQDGSVEIFLPPNHQFRLQFSALVNLQVDTNAYSAQSGSNHAYVLISYAADNQTLAPVNFLKEPEEAFGANRRFWNGLLAPIERKDVPPAYQRMAAKCILTLLSNWQSPKGGIKHDGIVPSYAVDYFMGLWAWDSWKSSAALAPIFPELAKNQIRSIFDYQMDDGMVIDCFYSDPAENNARDSKPPLAAWAVDCIFEATGDTAFVREMFFPMVNYYRWWYEKRDHNKNGMCEYGSTDGTKIAALWESGMDNAIRFDGANILKNSEGAYSLNQESVDLNYYLYYEAGLLKKFACLLGLEFKAMTDSVFPSDYFFIDDFFFDRGLDGSFIKRYGCEGYVPVWLQLCSPTQLEKAVTVLTDEKKFSTYIPFPTAAADDPKFRADGYWRGSTWLDQTYYVISGLRISGYRELADQYTEQTFERLEGLLADGMIYENYNPLTGKTLEAPNFSWSAAHLLLMYLEYKSDL